jgi:oligopeptidase B
MRILFLLLLQILLTPMADAQKMTAQNLPSPYLIKKPHSITTHSHTRIDDYYWLNNREDKEVIGYLEAENAFLENVMKPLDNFKESLFLEMKSRIKEEDESVPFKDGHYLYYSKYIEKGEYPVYCRKEENTGHEEILLDGNQMAKGQSYFNIGGFEISDNEQLMAFGVDTVSRRNYTLYFKDLKTGLLLPDIIELTEGGSYAWAADNATIFYIVRDQQTLLGDKVFKHKLGTPVSSDELVYQEKDNQFYISLERMKSKKYIMIFSAQNGISTECLLLNAAQPEGNFKTILPRQHGHEYFVEHYQNLFYIRTNQGHASNFKLMEALESEVGSIVHWKTKIEHREEVFLDDIEVFENHLVVQERKNGLAQLLIIDQKTNQSHYLNFGEPTYDAWISTNPNFSTATLRFAYSSLTTPLSTFDYEMNTQTKILKKEQTVLGGFDKNNYKTERIFIKARDGVSVPISIVYHKNTPIDGTAPMLQYAYGSYGYSIDANFSSTRLSLLNRGFVYAICHIRGGQEMGRHWYEDGKMLKKMNTFNDFIDCSNALITKKYTAANHLFAMGGSAGGLLMGVVANQAPELYKGIVAAVPFVDVVTTMLDESIPLTTGEFEEWGNPKNKEAYDYMLSYSPYDNVKPKKFPNILVTTGLHDSQVQYWEPAKWVAKIRANKVDNNLLLMKTDMEAGHGGASGRYASLKDTALVFAFLLDLVGKNE